MKCPKCSRDLVSRIDKIFVEMFGGCWFCDKEVVTPEVFEEHQDKAFKKKYEKK